MAHAYPKNEGGDVQTPNMGIVFIGNTHAARILVNLTSHGYTYHGKRDK
jgi:hypothetical protein